MRIYLLDLKIFQLSGIRSCEVSKAIARPVKYLSYSSLGLEINVLEG